MGVLSVRLDEELEKKIQLLMEKKKISDKSAYIRQLLLKSVDIDILDYLCLEVKNKRMSAWKAADTAQISLRAMIDELARREIILYDTKALEEDIAFTKRV